MKTNVKDSSMLQRTMATLLCICMLLMLMPVVPASAETTTTAVEIAGTDGKTMNVPTGHSGPVFRYETVAATNNASLTLAKVTASIYNIDAYIRSITEHLKYDTSKVALVSATGVKLTDNNATYSVTSPLLPTEIDSLGIGAGTATFAEATSSLFQSVIKQFNVAAGTITLDLSSANTGLYASLASTDGFGVKLPMGDPEQGTTTKIYDMYTMYFGALDASGKVVSMTDSVGEFLSLDSTKDPTNPEGFMVTDSTEAIVEGLSAHFDENFPTEPEPEARTYKQPFMVYSPGSTTDGLGDVRIDIYAADDTAYETVLASATSVTGNDATTGNATVEGLEAGTYKFKITYVNNDKKYDGLMLVGEDTDYTGTLTVDTLEDEDADTQAVRELETKMPPEDSYNLTFKVVDGDNNDAIISGASVNLGGSILKTGETGEVSFGALTPKDYTVQVEATGYENYSADGSATITVGDSTGGVSITKPYRSRFSYDSESQTVTLIMSSAKTQITIPIPVPQDEKGTAMAAADAGNLKVVISANPDGSTPATLSLPITVTATADADGNVLTVDSASGTITGINALVNLPRGNYNVTVTGAGLGESTTTLNIVPSSSGTVVNVGGEVADGTITNGYTDTITGESINLSEGSATAVTGETIYSDGTTAGTGTPATGGALSVADSGLESAEVITDPLYYAVGTFSDDQKQMTVKVYLKNIAASMGTFGMEFDTRIFTLAYDDFKLNTTDLKFVDAVSLPGGVGTMTNPVPDRDNAPNSDYNAFVWAINDNTQYLDATSEAKLIGTYTLNVKDGVSLENMMHNQAIYIKPYSETANGTILNNAYPNAADKEFLDTIMAEYWRDVDYEPTREGALTEDKALEGGFFQAYTLAADDTEGLEPYPADVRTQFVFEDYGNVAVTVQVTDTAGNPLSGVTVDAYPDGTTDPTGVNPSQTAQTNADGEATFAWPANKPVELQLEKDNYLTYPDDNETVNETVGAGPTVLGPYKMVTQEGHPVKLEENTDAVANLLGGAYAYNGKDYEFSLEPAPGYVWASGMPAPDKLEITLVDVNNDIDTADETLTASWNADKNKYVIAGADIKGAPTVAGKDAGEIIIYFDPSLVEPTSTEDDNLYTITAIAGTGGTVKRSTETAGTTGTITDTLASGTTTSDTYTFTPDTAGGYVVDRVVVNGVDMAVTDLQQKNGFDYQFTNVAADQTIVVTFGKENPETGEIDPADDNAILSVSLGEYGTAALSGDATDTLTGSATATYLVKQDGGVTIKINAAQDVARPDSTTETPLSTDYVIDQVLVNGVQVNVSTDDHWQPGAATEFGEYAEGEVYIGYDDVEDLVAGEITSVIITFRAAKESATDTPVTMQAIIETSVVSGKGTIMAAGTSILNVGDRPIFTITPLVTTGATGETWAVSSLNLTEPGKNTVPVDLKDIAADGTYTAPALEEGTTKLEVTFAEKTYSVQMKVDLGTTLSGLIAPSLTDVVVTFERVSDKSVETATADVTGLTVDVTATVPQGTWTVTVSKLGYLNYVINNFTINADGTVDNTYENSNGVIYFGTTDADVDPDNPAAKTIVMTIGDAAHDAYMISLDDVAQVVNGLVNGASDKRIERADFTENEDLAEEMSLVKQFFGNRYTKTTYAAFLGATATN